MKFDKILIILLFICCSANIYAFIKSGACDPYYASIKSNKANSHIGPGKEYKICFEYIQKGVPVMILAKYDHWRKIKDPLGNESWIHKNLLSSKRFLITIKDGVKLREHSNESSKELALINKNVVMELKSISGKWCNVNITSAGEKYRGWIQKSDVFGVFENEIK